MLKKLIFRPVSPEKQWMKARLYLLAVLLLLPAPGWAGLITYRDDKGTLHVVQSVSEIPEKYRKRTRVIASERDSNQAIFKLKGTNGSLLIDVKFGDAGTHPMVLDTGATSTMISKKIAEALKAKPLGYVSIHTASGLHRVLNVLVPEVSVGQFTVKDLKAVVHDLPSAGEAQGLLGVDFFNHFRMRLDTSARELHLERKP